MARHWDGKIHWQDFRNDLEFAMFAYRLRLPIKVPYPLAAGYSDFLIVPRSAIQEFSRLCGVFAAMNLFVEIAAPTALALSCEHISTEMIKGENWVFGRRDPRFARRGLELWSEDDIKALGNKHGWNEQSLLQSMGADTLYVHPVKLSRWIR